MGKSRRRKKGNGPGPKRNPGIGELERDLHLAFAGTRVPSEDYVFESKDDHYAVLDEFCDVDTMHEARDPLVVYGTAGAGKSALLANWLIRRQNRLRRSRNASHSNEFVFWHVVGCSRHSTEVGHMLRRLMTELKQHFELAREVNSSDERLSWDLPRFLELAARKARVIVVIDGLQRLRAQDGEAGLKWLPLTFPSNVRILLSATTPVPSKMVATRAYVNEGEDADEDGDHPEHASSQINKKGEEPPALDVATIGNGSTATGSNSVRRNRVLMELERRQWQALRIPGQGSGARTAILHSFLRLSAQNELAGASSSTFITGFDPEGAAAAELPGLLLFPSQQERIVRSLAAGNPLYMRILLRALRWSSQRGYDLWRVLDEWLAADSIPALYEAVLRRWEEGMFTSPLDRQRAADLARQEGGVSALQQGHLWPDASRRRLGSEGKDASRTSRLRKMDTAESGGETGGGVRRQASSTQHELDFAGDGDPDSVEMGMAMETGGDGSEAVWLKAQAQAEQILSNVQAQVQVLASGVMAQVEKHNTGGGKSHLEWLLEQEEQRSSGTTAAAAAAAAADSEEGPVYARLYVLLHAARLEGKGAPDTDTMLSPNIRCTVSVGPKVVDSMATAWLQGISSNTAAEATFGEGDGNADGGGAAMDFLCCTDEQQECSSISFTVESGSFHAQGQIGGSKWVTDGSKMVLEASELTTVDGAAAGSVKLSLWLAKCSLEEYQTAQKEERLVLRKQAVERESERKRQAETRATNIAEEKTAMLEAQAKLRTNLGLLTSEGIVEGEDEDDDYGDDDYEEDEYGDEDFEDAPETPMKGATAQSLAEDNIKVEEKAKEEAEAKAKTDAETKLKVEAEAKAKAEAAMQAKALVEARARAAKQKEEEEAKAKADAEEKQRDLEERRKREEQLERERRAREEETNANLDLVPVCLRGGLQVDGLGPLLGYALSLLYVARHGLQERELWSILALLREADERAKVKLTPEEEAEAAFGKKLRTNKSRLIDVLRKMDVNRDGTLSPLEFLRGLKSLDMGLSDHQLEHLLQVADSDGDGDLDYGEVISKFEQRGRNRGGGSDTGSLGSLSGTAREAAELAAILDDMPVQGGVGGEGGQSTVDGSAAERSLGAPIEEALLAVLCSLGVMYTARDRVLVLPPESEELRELVWWRYVGSSAGQEQWHLRLVRYFAEQPPSVRRCEELPWHLQKVRRWNALKDVLVDLRTFDIMFRPQLKAELFEYWHVLTEGPLYVSDDAALQAATSSSALPNSTLLLADLDSATALGLSPMRARQKKLEGQVATFDLVDEYNHAAEHWQHASRPTTHKLASMLSGIASFLLEFSQHRTERQMPPFHHAPLDMSHLMDVGIDPSDFVLRTASVGMGSPSLPMGSGVHDSVEGGEGGSRTGSVASITPDVAASHSVRKDAKAAAEAAGAGQHAFYYRRWLWVQFPWMALGNHVKVKAQQLQQASDIDGGGVGKEVGDIPAAGGHDGGAPGSGTAASSLIERAALEAAAKDNRFWAVKKIDPMAGPKVTTSKSVADARIKSHLSQSVSMGKLARLKDRLRERQHITGNIASQVESELGAPVQVSIVSTGKQKPRKSMAQPTAKDDSSIPYSSSSLRSQRRGTRFPSVEHLHRRQQDEIIDKMDDFANAASGRFGGVEQVDLVTAAEQDLEKPVPPSHLAHMPAHTFTYPSNQSEAQVAAAHASVSKLRGLHDELRSEVARKKLLLQESLLSVERREHQDAYTSRRMKAGEEMMGALEGRLARMQAAVVEAEELGAFYQRIIEVCLRNPSRDKQHLHQLEQQVELVRLQTRDLQERRRALWFERDHIDRQKKPQLEAEISKNRAMASKVLRKLHAVAERQRAHLGAMSSCGSSVASETTAESLDEGADSTFITETHTSRSRRSSRDSRGTRDRNPSVLDMVFGVTRDKNVRRSMKLDHAFSRIVNVTGAADLTPDELLEKFLNGQKLTDSLKEQQKQYEHKVAQLRVEKAEMQHELEELHFGKAEVEEAAYAAEGEKERASAGGKSGVGEEGEMDLGGAVDSNADDDSVASGVKDEDEGGAKAPPSMGVSSRDIRRIDESMFKAEIRLSQNMRKQRQVQAMIKEVKTGVQHLARLIASCTPHYVQGAIPLPPLSEDGSDQRGRILQLSDSDEEICKILTRCEDRVVAMSEALVLDSSKQLNSEDDAKKTLSERQGALAEQLQNTRRVSHLGNMSESNMFSASWHEPFADAVDGLQAKGDKDNGAGRKMQAAIRVVPSDYVDDMFENAMQDVHRLEDVEAEREARSMMQAAASSPNRIDDNAQAKASGTRRVRGRGRGSAAASKSEDQNGDAGGDADGALARDLAAPVVMSRDLIKQQAQMLANRKKQERKRRSQQQPADF